mmetsp:Transcript_20382/g.33457  ORF Transcript_20382/g.33457 Transcript_20382/m.33457 type:complete len:92 (-) Transcript_20382:250-525(-)
MDDLNGQGKFPVKPELLASLVAKQTAGTVDVQITVLHPNNGQQHNSVFIWLVVETFERAEEVRQEIKLAPEFSSFLIAVPKLWLGYSDRAK